MNMGQGTGAIPWYKLVLCKFQVYLVLELIFLNFEEPLKILLKVPRLSLMLQAKCWAYFNVVCSRLAKYHLLNRRAEVHIF